jgi:hypothetical protein
MTNHEFGAKLLTRIVLPDLAGIREDRNCLHPGFRFQITDGSSRHAARQVSIRIEQGVPALFQTGQEGGPMGRFLTISNRNPFAPPMCTSVSRTERKLPLRSRVNCSAVSAEAACKTLLFAQKVRIRTVANVIFS